MSFIIGYEYQADHHCPVCILGIMRKPWVTEEVHPDVESELAERWLDLIAEARGIDRTDEWSFDAGQFPKVITRQMAEASPVTCGSCGERLS